MRLPKLPPNHAEHIEHGNRYFQAQRRVLKKMRDDFGGHYLFPVAKHAIGNFPPDAIGRLEWWSNSPDPWWLRLHYSADIVAAGFEHTLGPGQDILIALRDAIDIIGTAYNHAQTATYGLVFAFLLPRFGT